VGYARLRGNEDSLHLGRAKYMLMKVNSWGQIAYVMKHKAEHTLLSYVSDMMVATVQVDERCE
jgi:hypothetical protein